MATLAEYYVNTNADGTGNGTTNATTGANGAFATMSAAEAALSALYSNSLVTPDIDLVVYHSGGLDTIPVDWDIATSATCRLRLLPYDLTQSMHPSGWKTDRYRLHSTNPSRATLKFSGNCKHFICSLQVAITLNSGAPDRYAVWVACGFAGDALHDLSRSRVLFQADSADVGLSDYCVYDSSGGNLTKAANFIWEVRGADKALVPLLTMAGGVGVTAYNGIFYGGHSSVIRGTSETIDMVNCAMLDAANNTSSSLYYSGSNYNKSDRADTYGANSVNSVTFTYTDAPSGDFTFSSGDSIVRDAGTDVSGVPGPLQVSDDCLGTARPQGVAFDIGPYELPSGGGGGGSVFRPSQYHFFTT